MKLCSLRVLILALPFVLPLSLDGAAVADDGPAITDELVALSEVSYAR